MNSVLFSVLINLYQGFLMIYFMKKRMTRNRHSLLYDCAAVAVIGGVFCLWEFADIQINDNLVFLLPFLYALIFSKDRWYVSLFWTLVLCACFLLSENLNIQAYRMQNISVDDLFQQSDSRISYVLSVNVTITLITCVVANIRLHPHDLSVGVGLCFILTLFMECAVSEALFVVQLQADQKQPAILFAGAGMLSTMLLTILLFEIMASVSAQKRMSDLKLQTMQMTQAHQEDLRNVYTDLLAAQHDLRHRIDAAERLLQTGVNEQIRDQAMGLLKDTDVLNEYVTGNTAVDAIILAKRSVMRQHQIGFRFRACSLEHLPTDEQDFCVLLSNMLENAVEGVLRIRESAAPREIQLTFSRARSMFAIVCENSMDASTVRQRNGGFLSSKEHPEIHGFGTQSMKQIVETYGGDITFKPGPQTFAVEILLPETDRT